MFKPRKSQQLSQISVWWFVDTEGHYDDDFRTRALQSNGRVAHSSRGTAGSRHCTEQNPSGRASSRPTSVPKGPKREPKWAAKTRLSASSCLVMRVLRCHATFWNRLSFCALCAAVIWCGLPLTENSILSSPMDRNTGMLRRYIAFGQAPRISLADTICGNPSIVIITGSKINVGGLRQPL
jgi:hypothetical protein